MLQSWQLKKVFWVNIFTKNIRYNQFDILLSIHNTFRHWSQPRSSWKLRCRSHLVILVEILYKVCQILQCFGLFVKQKTSHWNDFFLFGEKPKALAKLYRDLWHWNCQVRPNPEWRSSAVSATANEFQLKTQQPSLCTSSYGWLLLTPRIQHDTAPCVKKNDTSDLWWRSLLSQRNSKESIFPLDTACCTAWYRILGDLELGIGFSSSIPPNNIQHLSQDNDLPN